MSSDPKIHEITLTTLTYGGEAIGRLPDGRAVFVPFALPGDVAKIRLVEERKNFARAELLEVLRPSPDRIQPRCQHFFSLTPIPSPLGRGDGVRAACGGCHYQNLPYPRQLEAKRAILRDQLTRIGKIENPPVGEMVPAPDEWHYRNHIQFHLDKTGRLGFIAALASAASPNRDENPSPSAVLPIMECFLPQANLNALWPQLQFEAESPVQRVSLRAGLDDDLLLVLESDWPETPEMEIEADISVVHLMEDDAVVIAGNDHLLIQVDVDGNPPLQRAFKVSAASFFQVNTAMAGKMAAHLLAELPVSPSTTLLDVYCGVGLFSAFFAPRVRRVTGIEVAPSACEDFTVNLDEFDNVELYEAPAEDVLPALNEKPDVVIVDPPRAGLDKKVLDAILALRPAALAYVSCD
ncbi:MAG: class I SAM-dependent RNA methyltransferase, partial [Chloroflexi bacterium]